MGLVAWIGNLGWSAVGFIVPFLFVLTLVVFFHELGHFLVARWTGVAVKTFSIGFGPELFGFNDRKGTRWKVSAIPLGGYVRFVGDENEASAPDRDALQQMDPAERARSFAGKGVAARAAIVAAGPIANFVLAIVIFTMIFSIYGREVMTPRVDSVLPGSPAAEAGFQPGDVVEIDRREQDFELLGPAANHQPQRRHDAQRRGAPRRPGRHPVGPSQIHRNRGFRPQTADGHARRQPQPHRHRGGHGALLGA